MGNHPYVAAFHNEEEEIVCEKVIRIAIDDDHKYSISEYRDVLYQQIVTKRKESKRRAKESELAEPLKERTVRGRRSAAPERRLKKVARKERRRDERSDLPRKTESLSREKRSDERSLLLRRRRTSKTILYSPSPFLSTVHPLTSSFVCFVCH